MNDNALQDSLWLGALRQPIKYAMMGFSVAAVVVYAWMVLANLFLEDSAGMNEMLRPQGDISVYLMWITLSCSAVFGSLYLSDFRGAIEHNDIGIFDIVSLVFSRLGMLSIVFIELVMLFEVISRYVFNRPTLWANELSLWTASFLFLLAGLYAMQQRSHIRIYVIYDLMPRWAKKSADTLSVVLIWCFSFAMVWGSFNEAKTKYIRMETFGTAWDPPLPGTLKPAILIALVLVSLQALSNLIADWHKEDAPHSAADDIDATEIENIRRTLEEKS